MRIADYDTSRGDDCPSGWNKITANGIAMCRSPNDNPGCYPTTFSVRNIEFNKICGKIRGYQKGSPDAFDGQASIDNVYVHGISITIGNPRNHVWTYAAGVSDDTNRFTDNCPCARFPGKAPPSLILSENIIIVNLETLAALMTISFILKIPYGMVLGA